MKPRYVALIGGVIMAIGSFLPWLRLTKGLESISFNGIGSELEGGILTLLVGGAIVCAALAAREEPGRNGSLPAAILGILGIGVVSYYLLDIASTIIVLRSEGIQMSIEVGLVVIPIGGLLAIVGGYRHNPGEIAASVKPIGSVTSWQEIWKQALTRPIVSTFETLVHRPEVNADRAYKWILVTGLIGALLQLGLTAVFGAEQPPMAILLVPVLAPLGAVIGLWIEAHICNWLAHKLGGTGTYTELAYGWAASIAPLALITGALGSIPNVYALALNAGVGLYGSVLQVTAIKAVHHFSWGRAIASVLLIPVAVVLVAVAVIVFLTLAGTASRNI
jgi:hypothetical protein